MLFTADWIFLASFLSTYHKTFYRGFRLKTIFYLDKYWSPKIKKVIFKNAFSTQAHFSLVYFSDTAICREKISLCKYEMLLIEIGLILSYYWFFIFSLLNICFHKKKLRWNYRYLCLIKLNVRWKNVLFYSS